MKKPKKHTFYVKRVYIEKVEFPGEEEEFRLALHKDYSKYIKSAKLDPDYEYLIYSKDPFIIKVSK